MNRRERLSQAEVEAALSAVLESRPDALVVGLDGDARFAAIPPSLPTANHSTPRGQTAIDVVTLEHHAALFEQFVEVTHVGASALQVTTRTGQPATSYLFDLHGSHGVFVLVLCPDQEHRVPPPVDLPDAALISSRYGRIWRTELGQTVRMDQAITLMTGFRLEEVQAQESTYFIHPDDRASALTSWFDTVTGGRGTVRRWRGRILRRDGSWLWTEFANTNYLHHPRDPHILSEMVDISREMQAVEEMWAHRELLHRLTEALPLGVLQFDPEGQIQYTNERLLEHLGVEDRAHIAGSAQWVHPEDQAHLNEAARAAMSGVDQDLEVRYRRAETGEFRYLHLTLRALRDRDHQVTGVVMTVEDVTAEARARRELETRATQDALTGCLNRDSIMGAVNQALADLEPTETGLAVVFADLDRLKEVNDAQGHAAGDTLLQVVADRLRGALRAGDLIGRFGGDEFIILCPSVTDSAAAMEVAERLAQRVSGPAKLGSYLLDVAISVGVAWCFEPSLTADVVVAAADAAMYQAKGRGDGRPVVTTVGRESATTSP